MKFSLILSLYMSFAECTFLFGNCIGTSCKSSKAVVSTNSEVQKTISDSGYYAIVNSYLKENKPETNLYVTHFFVVFVKNFAKFCTNGVKDKNAAREFDLIARKSFNSFPKPYTEYIKSRKLREGLKANNRGTVFVKSVFVKSTVAKMKSVSVLLKKKSAQNSIDPYMAAFIQEIEYVVANKQLAVEALKMFGDPITNTTVEYVVPFRFAYMLCNMISNGQTIGGAETTGTNTGSVGSEMSEADKAEINKPLTGI